MPTRGIDAISPHAQAIAHARTPGGNGRSFTADSRTLFKRRMLHGPVIHGLYEFIIYKFITLILLRSRAARHEL
jgi:hypothetical protein